jgi:hypothetical protein
MSLSNAFRPPFPFLLILFLLTGLGLSAAPATGLAAEPGAATPPAKEMGKETLAIFPFSYSEGMPRPPVVDEAHEKRLALMTETLRKAMADSGRYDLVSVSERAKAGESVSPQAAGVPAAECVSCALDAAKAAGAKLAMIGEVRKMTAIVFGVTVSTYDVASGKAIARDHVDVSGDSDTIWRKGVEWLVRNRLLK